MMYIYITNGYIGYRYKYKWEVININRNNSLEEQLLTEPGYYILLALLVPMHGYGVTKYIEELTDGEMVIGPATLYTMLKKMQAQYYITLAGEDGRRKIYNYTDFCYGENRYKFKYLWNHKTDFVYDN